MKPRHESQSAQSDDTEFTESNTLSCSVVSVSGLCVLCDKKRPTGKCDEWRLSSRPGAQRSLEDSYEDKEAVNQRRRATVLIVLVALAAAAIFIRWKRLETGRYFWQPAPAQATVPAAPVPVEAKK